MSAASMQYHSYTSGAGAGILAVPNFRRFYAGYVTSLLGTSMSTVAIAWAVLDNGGSATGLGFVFAANVVSQVLLLPFAGAVADRLGRRRVMLAADVLRGGAQASLAVALFAGRPPLWVFVLLAWLVGTGEAFFDPAQDALTVEMAPRDQLGNANALYGLAFGTSAVFAVGAVYGLASSAVVLSLRSVRAVRWRGEDQPPVSAASPPRAARRRRLAAPPP
jgi:MFS family permease